MKTLVIRACIANVPVLAFGHAAIAGAAREFSGARLPGVISSSALIEKSRSTITDGTGQYRLEDLRPRTHNLRFTLKSWRLYERDAVELTGLFTATVDAQRAVGAMSETITVIDEIPAVDAAPGTARTCTTT